MQKFVDYMRHCREFGRHGHMWTLICPSENFKSINLLLTWLLSITKIIYGKENLNILWRKTYTSKFITNLSIIFNLKISRFFAVSSWLGTRDTRHLMALMMAESASFLASFFASFFSSSSVRFSRKAGTTSYWRQKTMQMLKNGSNKRTELALNWVCSKCKYNTMDKSSIPCSLSSNSINYWPPQIF